MGNNTDYRLCPKCGLNYITGAQTACTVCVAANKPYRGKYCENCGEKSGLYKLCWRCHKAKDLSVNEKRAADGYRTDTGMVGNSTKRTCRICGVPTYGQLCGRCYMATRDNDNDDDNEKERQ